jgi:hypothetical protein
VRPATYAFSDTNQAQLAELQFRAQGGGPWTTVKQITIQSPSNCYFDVHLAITQNGNLRLTYSYPQSDNRLPAGTTVDSRPVAVTIR